jgi:hypothetical protein
LSTTRFEGPPDVQDVVAEFGEPFADARRGPVVHPVLEFVDLLVERVHQAEVALRDVVHDVVHDLGGRLVLAARGPGRARVVGGTSLRRLAHRDDRLPREDEADLLVVDRVLLGQGDRDEEDAEHVVAVRLQLGTRLVSVTGRLEKLLQRPIVDALRQVLAKLLGGGVEQVDPVLADHRRRA